MRIVAGEIVLSPSDLMRFQGCAHATSLDLRYLRGEPLEPAEEEPEALVLQARGDEHERSYLADLQIDRDVVSIERTRDFSKAAEATRAAMAAGASVIFQGALAIGRWQGWSDFLERVEEPSSLGAWSYEAVDTKLKRRVDPKFVVQLSIYSRAIAELQGRPPNWMHVALGDGSRAPILYEDARYYVDRLARRFEAFIDDPSETVADPVAACSLCRWRKACATRWEVDDSLVRVAGITRLQRAKLVGAGITTRSALAVCTRDIPRLDDETLARLKVQAELQTVRQSGAVPKFVLRDLAEGRGFALLPEPAPGDLFFDMEGDPYQDGGLEYLFGIVLREDGRDDFKAWWAHDREEERAALLTVLDFMVEHLGAHPGAHVYHYNHYEPTALKRLSGRYGVGEAQVDHLLRTKAFVDLYRVSRQAILTSEEGLSLKDLEAFYMQKRTGEVATAAGSVVAYENWLASRDHKILEEIAAYNDDDCRSTRLLRDWLVAEVRPPALPWPILHEDDGKERPIEDPETKALTGRVEAARGRLGDGVADLLIGLIGFHQRAQRPAWWEYFDRPLRDYDELLHDLETLVGLDAVGPALGVERDYTYPEQETKLKAGSRVMVLGEKGEIQIHDLDRKARRIRLKFPRKLPPPANCHVVPAGPLRDKVLRDGVRNVAASLVAADDRYRAISDFLARRAPRLVGHAAASPIIRGEDIVAGAVDAVLRLYSGCLPIQGPPGTGKTYVASCAILALVAAGRRVAVMSNAHKAIDNLLDAVAQRARECGQKVSITKKGGAGESAPEDPMIDVVDSNEDPLLDTAQVVGGTAFLFARTERNQMFDTLVVDEAGQVALANLVAAGTCARNIVLVGDQAQLPQPVQGVHPGESGLSSLEYLLAGKKAIGADEGVFLPRSRRMHPDVCTVVSKLFYEGKLTSDEGAARHRLSIVNASLGLPSTGVLLREIRHQTANTQTSHEEAAEVGALYRGLFGSAFTDRDGGVREIGVDDILVVSPYNAQVNLLAATLPTGARVGTVDKFQGQEAPVCIMSMATSGEDEVPRGIDFLFSPNRMNVAISRAQALAIVICSDRLLDVQCSTLDELRRVGAVCSLAQVGA